MFSNISVGTKLNVLVGLLIAATLALAGAGLYFHGRAQSREAANLQLGMRIGAARESAKAAEAMVRDQLEAFNVFEAGPGEAPIAATLNRRHTAVGRQLAELRLLMSKLPIPTALVDEAGRRQVEFVRQNAARRENANLNPPPPAPVPPTGEKIGEIAEQLETFARQETARMAAAAAAESNQLKVAVVVALLLVTAAGIYLRFAIRHGILRSIRAAAHVIGRVAAGDLTVKVGLSSHGETQKMLEGLEGMAADLQALVREVSRSAHTVADTSAQIAQGNLDLSQRTDEQAGTLARPARADASSRSTRCRKAGPCA
jgi:methyl-accepting chemotaxis protein